MSTMKVSTCTLMTSGMVLLGFFVAWKMLKGPAIGIPPSALPTLRPLTMPASAAEVLSRSQAPSRGPQSSSASDGVVNPKPHPYTP